MENSKDNDKAVSIRKLYLTKRAGLIRENFGTPTFVLGNFIREIQSQEFNATKDELMFAQCLDWMQQHLHLDAHITKLAKGFDISVRKIQRLFSFFTGKTYTTVLLEMRLDESKKYLAELKRSIGEVAYLAGIKDHAYFTYLFRKHTGLTPSQYRVSLMKE